MKTWGCFHIMNTAPPPDDSKLNSKLLSGQNLSYYTKQHLITPVGSQGERVKDREILSVNSVITVVHQFSQVFIEDLLYSRDCGEQMEKHELDIILAYSKIPKSLVNN